MAQKASAKKKADGVGTDDIGVSDTQKDVKTDIDTILKAAIDNAQTLSINTERQPRWHGRSHVKISIGEVLKRIKSGKYIYPKFQRDYVWGTKQLKDLLWSMRNNYSAGAIIVSECEGLEYITDGLQRTMSFLHISTDSKLLVKKKKLTEEDVALFQEESKKILEYEILVETVHDMTVEEMPEYFILINGGTPLKAAIKERSRLDHDLRSATMEISSQEFFKNANRGRAFSAQSQGTVIAYCALLAAAGEPVGKMKVKHLCDRIIGNRNAVLENQQKAIEIANRLSGIYENILSERIKRSMNSAFIGVLMFVMANHPEYTNQEIGRLINYIWENPNMSTKKYRETIAQGSADAINCKNRYDLLIKWLKNPPQYAFDEQGVKAFNSIFKDRILMDSAGKNAIYFDGTDEEIKKILYVAHLDNSQEGFDAIIKKYGEPTGH